MRTIQCQRTGHYPRTIIGNDISSTSVMLSTTGIGFSSFYSGALKFRINCAVSERKSHRRHAHARSSSACPSAVSNSVLATSEMEAPHAPQLAKQPTRARSNLIIYLRNMASTELVMQVCMWPMPWISVSVRWQDCRGARFQRIHANYSCDAGVDCAHHLSDGFWCCHWSAQTR